MEEKTYADYIDLEVEGRTTEELKFIYGVLQSEYDDYSNSWANEVSALLNSGVKPDSFFGARKFKKLANKYADILSDIDISIEDIELELSKRGKLDELEPERVNEDSLTNEEYFKLEEAKSEKFNEEKK